MRPISTLMAMIIPASLLIIALGLTVSAEAKSADSVAQLSSSDVTDNASERIPSQSIRGVTYGDKAAEFRWIPGYGDAVYGIYDLTMRVMRRARKIKTKSDIEKKIDSWMKGKSK